MNHGELLTKLTIWVALTLYAAGAGPLLLGRERPRWLAAARWAWTFGCAAFIAHVVCAFTYYHSWSHDAAYAETARQTAEMTGLHWGGGLYLNYFFGAAWLAAVLWWWIAPARFARRSPRLTAAWNAFFLFMIFNGTVVFGSGPARWLGAVLCAGLVVLWWVCRRGANSVASS